MRPAPLAAVLVLVGALALALGDGLPGPGGASGGASRAAAQPASGEPTPQTDASVPARNVMMIGATPQEAGAPGADETWGVGTPNGSASETTGAGAELVRYTREGGWSLGPALPTGFKLEQNPLAGQMTPQGTGVLAGTMPGEKSSRQVLLVRQSGGAFVEAPRVPAEGETLEEGEKPLLKEGEILFGSGRPPLIAPLQEAGAGAGALVVPVRQGAGVEDQVLHFDGGKWTSEPIEIPKASSGDFRVLGIGASSPSNAWLLAQLSSKASYPPGAVALFRRMREGEGESAKWSWKPVTAAGGKAEEAEPLTVPVQGASEHQPFTVAGTGEPPRISSQLLTVTGEGVWVDGERADVHALTPASTTMFFKPEGEAAGHVTASWCILPAGAPTGTPACEHELPEALPTGSSRSIAWPASEAGGPFGARVITGLPEGVSLRLDGESLGGESFTRVLTLGATAGEIPGGALGAAFSNATEGWLGVQGLPVHLTLEPAPSRLTPWPVPFRHALTAIAPQPGAPIGSLSSEALAVGDQGEVARFEPGKGWLPESLYGAGQKVKTPRLRALAWPTPSRAYAVGDENREGSGPQMWLWRGETGLWEKDPATPPNFRGNLLGIAFDANNPARGYAVGSAVLGSSGAGASTGSGGVLLRYGKTWTQEAALPPQVAGASFTSIAFAGSEAIVTYRELPNPEVAHYTGGLLVNNGSGWQVDQGAAAVMGSNAPLTVAGLPDGGAAFETAGPEGTRVFERESAGASWQPTPTPLPGAAVGSLALFREGGALRAIASSGGARENYEQEHEPAPPPGFPPNLIGAYPIGGGAAESGVLRQTPTGWSDESHELNPVGEPEGKFSHYDLPYRPEPVLAVLIDPTGGQGWAVGGEIHEEQRLDTASIERYPADGVKPLGVSEAAVPRNPEGITPEPATFAIGGGAQCAAPCADRERAGVGPDVWLSAALSRAHQIGVRAFLYTGPRVTSDETSGLTKAVVPFARELARYAQILASTPLTYAAATPQDLDARPESQGTEATFEQAFAGFPQAALSAGDGAEQGCHGTVGCQTAYYALSSEGAGGAVRVIVLDDSGDVDPKQVQWLAGQLENAKSQSEPAIVVGNADLNAQIVAGDVQAIAVAQTLVGDGASAYFYDSPEENVTKPLRAGGGEVPTFGSGTLGYVNVKDELSGDFHGASGFLLGEVDVAARNPRTNVAPVHARLIPDIGELALEAKDGILLRRSEPALFDALARRPRAGNRASSGGGFAVPEVDPYIPIPSNCVGSGCAIGLFPEYTFSSSRPDIGDFVAPNLASREAHAVLQGPDGKPIHDPLSGLFCAYNAGTTIVTISAGGLSSSLPVTVQAGSVRQPCGTVPLKELPARQQQATIPPPLAPAPVPAGPAPASAPPPVPLPVPPVIPLTPARSTPRPPPLPFFLPPALAAPVLAFVPPPVPTPARPTPPSGTSAVTSPVEMAEQEEEEESATESVSNQALAYRAPEHEPSPAYILGIVLLAAFAGASLRRPRRGRRKVRVAPATISSMRTQRRMDAERRRL